MFEICFALWLFDAIAIVVARASFMVMVIWCHHYYYCTCFVCVCAHLVPSLLLLFPSLSWSLGGLLLLLLLVFFLWSWSPNAIATSTCASFEVVVN